MLIIHGEKEDSPEYNAAELFAQSACDAMPEIENDTKIVLEVFPSVQCFGQKVQDIDLLVFFADYRDENMLTITTRGHKIHSFCASIEVKGHSPDLVVFEGANCLVTYQGKRHNVTSQSENQKYSITKYIKENHRGKKAPWVTNLIWLTRVPNNLTPKIQTNILGADSTWNDFLEAVDLLAGAGNNGQVATFSTHSWMREITQIFSKRIEASKIDRKRLEAITKSVLDRSQQQYAEKLGQQLLIYKGRGGTGKTIRLIRTAYQAYEEQGARVLLLTYNKALVADLKRLLTLLGIKDAIGDGSIAVKTIHSFMYDWLLALGTIRKGQSDFLGKYESFKREALDFIKAGVISESDFEQAKVDRSRDLSWDFVLIDESQDWPETERDLIYALYGHKQVIIADGIDQFVRGVEKIDWRENIPRSESQIVSLKKSLRLKSTLCQTVGHFAEQIDFANWNLVPLPEAHGGKVIVVVGNALSHDFHRRLAATARTDGNRPIDMLLCVPPGWVKTDEDEGRHSVVADQYRAWGWDVWDAVDTESRSEYPTSLDQYRVVQYESCRGLEGWVVVNLGLDEFFEYKKSNAEFSEIERDDMYFESDTAALEYAKKWLMIPLTRAIDTLVLHVSDPESYVGRTLAALHEKYPEDVQWIHYD